MKKFTIMFGDNTFSFDSSGSLDSESIAFEAMALLREQGLIDEDNGIILVIEKKTMIEVQLDYEENNGVSSFEITTQGGKKYE
jgi:hypothetical protein